MAATIISSLPRCAATPEEIPPRALRVVDLFGAGIFEFGAFIVDALTRYLEPSGSTQPAASGDALPPAASPSDQLDRDVGVLLESAVQYWLQKHADGAADHTVYCCKPWLCLYALRRTDHAPRGHWDLGARRLTHWMVR
jgi:hypothetical protein